jgi:hypothetical protein
MSRQQGWCSSLTCYWQNSRATYPQMLPPWQSGSGICWSLSLSCWGRAPKSEVFSNLHSWNNTFYFPGNSVIFWESSCTYIEELLSNITLFPICHIHCKAAEQVVLEHVYYGSVALKYTRNFMMSNSMIHYCRSLHSETYRRKLPYIL